VDLQGRTTELGRYLAEQLSVEMVNADGVSVADRANIKNILAEHKLTLEGLVEPENARKLGKFAGIDAILTGSVTILNGNVVLTVKAISTETAQIVAASKAVFKNTSELQQLSTRPAASASPSSDVNTAVKTSPQSPASSAGVVEAAVRSEPVEKPSKKAGPLVVTVDAVRQGKRGARVFLTIDSEVSTSLEVTNGRLIDSESKEMRIAHSMRTDIVSGAGNNVTVETIDSWNFDPANLKPPFDLSLDIGLSYGTMDAKTYSVSFHDLR
jgi:hypothetical protein